MTHSEPVMPAAMLVLVLALMAPFVRAQQDAALAPEAAAALLPEVALQGASPASPSAFTPMSEAAKNQLVAAIAAGNEAAKAEVKAALADPTAAYEQYVTEFQQQAATAGVRVAAAIPGGPSDWRTKAQRLRIFTANLKKIDAINAAGGTTASLGITPFTHMTNAEFRRIMVPHDFAKDAAPASVAQEAGPADSSLGRKLRVSSTYSTINWLTAGYITPARDQGQCGSCACFASTALAEYCYIKRYSATNGATNTTTDLSEQDLMDCYSTTKDMCKGASLTTYPSKIIKATTSGGGNALESLDPYVAKDTDNCFVTNAQRVATIKSYTNVGASEANYLTAVAKGPLEISIDGGGYNIQHYSGGVLGCPTTNPVINHAVTIVGYINRINLSLLGSTSTALADVWIVKNSWSQYWGSSNPAPYKGFFYLQKDCPGGGAVGMYNGTIGASGVSPACS